MKEVPPRHFSSNKHVLQLACELAAHPQTYAAILHIIEFGVAGVSATAQGSLDKSSSQLSGREESDEEEERDEEGAAEEIADEDKAAAAAAADMNYPFFELGPAKMTLDTSLGLYADLESSLLRPPTTPKQVHELQAFKEKINSILMQSSPKREHSPSLNRGRLGEGAADLEEVSEQFDAPLLDEDLRNYLEQEKNNRILKKMGYFNQEEFLKFK